MTGDFGFALGFLAGDRPSRPKSMPTNNFMFHSAVYRTWRSHYPIRWLWDGCDCLNRYVGCGMGAIAWSGGWVAGWVRSDGPVGGLQDGCDRITQYVGCGMGAIVLPHTLRRYAKFRVFTRRLCVPTRSIVDGGYVFPPDPLWTTVMRCHPIHCGWRLCVPTRSIVDDGCALPPDPLWMAIAHPHHPITSTTPTNYSGPTTISAGC
ncbi:MAG: hypothetical protein AAFY20_17200 [Cyanobacteria bacterium J06639_14]